MSYFNQIYLAAKNKDIAALNEIFSQGACIDIRENSAELNSPAGKLAREGDIVTAQFLVEHFGANPVYVVRGLLDGGFKEQANEWAAQFDIGMQDLLFTQTEIQRAEIRRFAYPIDEMHRTSLEPTPRHAANAGNIDLSSYKKQKDKTQYLEYAAHGGHIYFLEKAFNKDGKIPHLYWLFAAQAPGGDVGHTTLRLHTEKLALHAFSFIDNPKFMTEILRKMIESRPSTFNYDIEPLMNKARKIHLIMKQEKIGYADALKVCDLRKIPLQPLVQRNFLFYHSEQHLHILGKNRWSINKQANMNLKVKIGRK